MSRKTRQGGLEGRRGRRGIISFAVWTFRVRDATLIMAGPRSVAEWRQRWPWAGRLQRPTAGPLAGGNEIGKGSASIGRRPPIGSFLPAGPSHQGEP